jgi:hypothetical protein
MKLKRAIVLGLLMIFSVVGLAMGGQNNNRRTDRRQNGNNNRMERRQNGNRNNRSGRRSRRRYRRNRNGNRN